MEAKKRLIKRLKRLLSDAEKEGYQFLIVDDSVQIGTKELDTDWPSLFEYPQRNVDKFDPTGCTIIAVST